LEIEDEDGGSEEGEEGDDDEPQRSPSPEADITKSKGNYQYQQTYDKIASVLLNQFFIPIAFSSKKSRSSSQVLRVCFHKEKFP